MAHQVRGVVAKGKGEPVTVETIEVPDPGPGEVLVAVQACGVCHTDLHYREGAINDEFPFLLGHEAAGVIESVGPDVTGVAPGDFVILNWRAVCGECRSCRRGRPWYCFSTHNATQKMTLDGVELSPGARHRRLRREDAGGGRAGHQGRSPGQARDRGPPRLRGDGRPRCRAAHRRGDPGRLGRGVRVRRRGRRGHRRGPAGRGVEGHRGRPRRRGSSSWPGSSGPPTPWTRRPPIRSRRSASSPTATAPTCASRRWATPR